MSLSLIPKNPSILIADDDQSTRILLRLVLQKEQYRILEAVDGLDCLKQYQQNKPDLVLLDALMPIMDGFSCCEKLVEMQKQESKLPNFYQVPILMITGLNDRESVNKAFAVGAVDYITKPIQPNVLRHRLRYLLEAKWAEKTIRESEQKYRLVVNSLREGIFQLDTQGIIIFLNSAWKNILGFSLEESFNTPLAQYIHPQDKTTYNSAVTSLLNQQEIEICLSLRYLKKNQEVGWMELDSRRIMAENQIIGVSGTINEITEIKRRQAYQQVENQTTKALANSNEVITTITIILSILCQNLGWDLGEYWSLNTSSNLLRLNTAWHIPDDKFKEFIDASSQINFNIGEGLPGRVWKYDSTLWINHLTKDLNFSRTDLATQAGFHSAFGFLVGNGVEKLGVICLFCSNSKQIDSDFLNLVRTIGTQVSQYLKRQQAEAQLQKQNLILQSELNQAGQYVSSLLPDPNSIKNIAIQQLFIPSIQLGGDIFDYYWLDPENLAIYLLDVAGHGVRPALLSVSILNLLRSQSLYNTNFYDPWTVVTELNRLFPMDEKGENYFTIWYGVYNLLERKLFYCSAAHPPALLLSPTVQGFTVQELTNENIAVGMFPEFEFEQASCSISPGSSLYLFSDGVYEIPLNADRFWGFSAFTDYIQAHHACGIDNINSILNYIQQLNKSETLEDDFSLIRFNFL